MKPLTHGLLASLFFAPMFGGFAHAGSFVDITEAMVSSSNGPEWFELRNHRTFAYNLVDHRIGSGPNFNNATTLLGITSIAPSEVVLYVRSDNPGTDIAAFRAAWNISASIQIGSYATLVNFTDVTSGSGPSSTPVIGFNSTGAQIDQHGYSSAITGASLYNNGTTGNQNPFTGNSTVGQFGAYASTYGDIGSPGVYSTAIPEPANAPVLAAVFAGGLALLTRRRRIAPRG